MVQLSEQVTDLLPEAPVSKATTAATFANDVLTESGRQPVLVDFWAPWCQPCKQLTPLLEKAVKAAQGKVKLVTMNIDEHPQIAGQLGIRSIPAVIAFQRAQPVDGFMGALPENQVRGFIERLVGPLPEEEDLRGIAEAALAAGDPLAALEIFRALHTENPDDIGARAGLIKASVAAGELAEAERLLAEVPASAAQDPALGAARAAVETAIRAAGVGELGELERRVGAEPNDHQARYDLAIALNAQGRRNEAADALLTIIKRDRDWNEAAARKQLLQFFEAWGNMDAATGAARRKLSALLFS
ncbi:co-chaperone YbbN [Methylovirgula ligni]|uniref:Thioredoxin n=1 Tax=Methylovirgula ligni TaxID=569860 RepID=A0A3D9Z3X7_9HYPH|nr:co-chaperone YbbN [Methylovirgula ligni]QAY95220.1 co-chaperone YbbN [Methylovirgula ligni]REF89485.1 thioredoxin [Methylovirgula ligni]